jgi:hypothetical protein
VSDPISATSCRQVSVDEAHVPNSKWNAFNQVLRILTEID